MYPKKFKDLINQFSALPSIGPKMAERLVLYLFKQHKNKLEEFARNLLEIKNLKHCDRCFNIAEDHLCEICKNKNREQKIICVVEDPLDVISLERTGSYKGLYHVLGGVIFSGNDSKTDLKLPQLLKRIQEESTEEVILATNPTTEGDATALYLKRKLQELNLNISITKLARGLATGADIEYADETTLSAALTNRRKI